MGVCKILVVGDVKGKFRSLFNKVDRIIEKNGRFEYVLCVGTFFSSDMTEWEEVKSGKLRARIMTLTLGANMEEHVKYFEKNELAENVVYLGRSGSFTGAGGIRVAYLSGLEPRTEEEKIAASKSTETRFYFSESDVTNLITSIEGKAVDILITSPWPEGVTKYATPIEEDISGFSSTLVARLAKEIQPRYHFCGLGNLYYQRIPYRNHLVLNEAPINATRFMALASVYNEEKRKWLFAFNVDAAVCMTVKELAAIDGPTTNCPYDTVDDLNAERVQNEFFFGTYVDEEKEREESRKRGYMPVVRCDAPNKHRKIDSENCWFCFSNLDAEKELVISIGTHCYMALAKGFLVPEHVLIVPIKHTRSSADLSDEALEEIDKYKKSLVDYFQDKSKDVVFFERNYFSPHVQIQAVPVPKEMKEKIQETFNAAAAEHEYEFSELPHLACVQKVVSKTEPFFYFELIVDKKTEIKYLHVITKKFPLQFGRVVLGNPKVLNVPDRVDWRHCEDSKTVEKEIVEAMKKDYEPHDPTKIKEEQ